MKRDSTFQFRIKWVTAAATIKYYVNQGLLPQPLKTSKTMAYYGDVHIQRLNEIKRLKKQGQDLQTIKQSLMTTAQSPPVPQDEIVYTRARNAIITAAVALFREKGYQSTNMMHIAERAHIGKGTIYQYFKGKEDLFFECAENIFDDIGKDDASIRDETDGLKRLWNRGIALTRNTRHIFDMLNLARGSSIRENTAYKAKFEQIMHNFVEPIRADVETAITQGQIRPMDPTLLAHLLIGAIEYGLYYEIEQEADAQDTIAKGWAIVFGGLALKQTHAAAKDRP